MHPFEYDPFQREAIENIRKGISVFVSAPTGAGKTVIAEIAVEEALKAGGSAIYTAPIKALSNQKFRDFHARYGEKVGILTGDITLNPDADILIMTTEIYRNTLFEGSSRFSPACPAGRRCRWVIFDEIHYLDDPERGTVWEEALLLTPRETEILALSATIPNAQQLAAWIEKIHGRPVKVVQESHRPIPLKFAFQCHDELYRDMGQLKASGYRGQDRISSGRKPFRMRRHRGGKYSFKKSSMGTTVASQQMGRPNRADHLVEAIRAAGHLPCLYFTFSRKRSEDLAWEFASLRLSSPVAKATLLQEYDELCRRFEITKERSASSMRDLILQGIAFHHAGLLPTLKEVVEILFSKKLLSVIVTTETFALGINMPARSVVLDTLAKRSNGPRMVLRVRDLSQMAGRAGRRGMDEAGFVYLRVNPSEIAFHQLSNLLQGTPEQVSSRFNLTYATVLHLYRNYGEDLLPFYQLTLHAFQSPPAHQREALEAIRRRLTLLQKLKFTEPIRPGERQGRLTPKGEFALSIYGYELLLSELFQMGLLETLGIRELGILLSALVYEPRRGVSSVRLPRHIRELAGHVEVVVAAIHGQEKHLKVSPMTKGPSFQLWGAMERWIAGAQFEKALEGANVAEGELIRYFRMTIQLARACAAAPAAHKGLKDKAMQLVRQINRDEVDAEAELRRSL